MADKMKLTGIELTTPDGDPVKLTVEQARDLYTQLRELFGKAERQIIIERDHWPIPWRPYRPFWVGIEAPASTSGAPPREPRIMCRAASGLAVSYLGKES